MAESSISDDELMCPICLDLLKDPVTVPCGHNYCMRCITDYWDQEDQRGIYRCPQCRKTFTPRPDLGKNTMLADVIEKLEKTKLQSTVPAHCYAEHGDVKCDVCTGRKLIAIKSCLMCLNSYCQTHLDQHENLFRGKRHNLIEATGRLQEMICSRHDKMMEIYCNQCQRRICMLCMVDEHKNHDIVSISTASAEKQKEINQKIQEREKDLQMLREMVDSYKRSAQTAVEDCEMMFTQLSSEVTQLIRDQEKIAVSQAEGLLEGLKREIKDLKKKDAEIKTLSQTQDQFLQGFQSLSLSGSTENFNITPDVSFDAVVISVAQFREKLPRFCREEMDKIFVKNIQMSLTPEPRNRREFLQCFHQFTMDQNTVNNYLGLLNWNQEAKFTDPPLQYPDHPDRFDCWTQVLCTEAVSGRCYWEVEWSGQGREGVGIGVAYKSISRKGNRLECAAGRNNQSWSFYCCPYYYSFIHNNMETYISLTPTSRRVGVYMDHSAGILSFYSVSDTMTLIHRVQTTFTQPLYPMFELDEHSAFRLCRLSDQ